MSEAEGCGAYVAHIQQEHHQLNELLLQTGHEIDGLSHAIPRAVALAHLSQRLVDLHQQLQSHFTEEETGGCLEEAVARCPSLSNDCKTAMAKHTVLDRTLEQLVN